MAGEEKPAEVRKIRRAIRKCFRETGQGEPAPCTVLTAEDREAISESTRLLVGLGKIFTGITNDTTDEKAKKSIKEVSTAVGESFILDQSYAHFTTVVDGHGGNVECKGPYHRVLVKGFVESVIRAGEGDLFAIADINGDVTHNGTGHLCLKSKIGGNVIQSGNGFFGLFGNIVGSVLQNEESKTAEFRMEGDINGQIRQDGSSSIIIKGNVNGDIVQNGNGSIIIQGTHSGRVIKSSSIKGGTVKIYDGNRVSMFM